MKKEITFLTLCALLFAPSCPAYAQQPKKVLRIGYLTSRSPALDFARAEAIRLALRDLGYIEGQNIVFDYRYAEGKRDRQPELAAELVRLRVDVIVAAGGNGVIRAAMNTTKTIPIVMTGQGSDPVEAGFVKSLARPGGNVTGMTNLLVQLGDKRLELLKETVPNVVRVAVPYNPGERTHELELREIQTAARGLRVTVQPWEVRSADDLDGVFAAMGRKRPDGLQVLGGPLMRDNRKRIVDFALNNRIPSIFTSSEAVSIGGLMYYGADLVDSYRQVAWYIDKILKGSKSADLPVQQPMKFEFVINLKAAKQIGLTIPPSVLSRADSVIR